jgi:hypothetical protein
MKALEIIRLLRNGHNVEFARAAMSEPRLVFAVWQLMCKESEFTRSAISDLLVKGAGIPVYCALPDFVTTIQALIVPEQEQGSLFGKPGTPLWEQATAEVEVLTAEAQRQASQGAACALELLRLLLKDGAAYERVRDRIVEDATREPIIRSVLARAGGAPQRIEIGDEVISVGGGEALSQWHCIPGVSTFSGVQIQAPCRNGLAVKVMRDGDDLPATEKARQLEVFLGPGIRTLSRVRIAMATAVPVRIDVRIEECIADGRRRYTLEAIEFPDDIRETLAHLVKQADLFKGAI